MKYVLTVLFLLQLSNLAQAQSKQIEISVDDFYRIYFDADKIMPKEDSQISIDFWGKAISEKKTFE